mgnify:CR=1 FL=1
MKRQLLFSTAALLALSVSSPAWSQSMEAGLKFLDEEIGDLSTLSRAEQEAELEWFMQAAAPYTGMDIKVVSETITTHEYESKGAGARVHRADRDQGHA